MKNELFACGALLLIGAGAGWSQTQPKRVLDHDFSQHRLEREGDAHRVFAKCTPIEKLGEWEAEYHGGGFYCGQSVSVKDLRDQGYSVGIAASGEYRLTGHGGVHEGIEEVGPIIERIATSVNGRARAAEIRAELAKAGDEYDVEASFGVKSFDVNSVLQRFMRVKSLREGGYQFQVNDDGTQQILRLSDRRIFVEREFAGVFQSVRDAQAASAKAKALSVAGRSPL